MAESNENVGPERIATSLLTLFIPSTDRFSRPISQDQWVDAALALLGERFRGATAWPKGKGVWRDDTQGGKLVYDETVVVHCYTTSSAIELHHGDLLAFLLRWGKQTNQGAVAYVIDGTFLEIPLPLQDKVQP